MKKTKWFVVSIAACAMVLFAAGCKNSSDDSGETETVAVEAIGLNPATLSLVVGTEKKLTAIVKPDDATDKTVTWSSSKKEVATVGSDGTVTAVKPGKATITAQAGEKTATCEVTVTTCNHYYAEGKCTKCGLQMPVIDGGTIDEWGNLTKYTGKATELVIPDGVKSIDYQAFKNCKTLTSVTIPASVTKIGSSVFEGCTSLKEVTIPDSVTEIGGSVFKGCTSLESVTIPASVTEIEINAFLGCTSLKEVTIPDSVTEIGSSVFKGCTSLKEIQFKGTKEQWKAIKGSDTVNIQCIQCSDGYIGIKEIPEYLKMSGTIVTGYTDGLPADLTIPEGVTEIGSNAFYKCESLTSVNYAGTKAQWEKIYGISGAYLSDKTIVCTDGEVTVE